MCNRYRLSPSDYAKLEAQGVVPPFPPDESWPVRKHPFETITRPTDPAVIVVKGDERWQPALMRRGFLMGSTATLARLLSTHSGHPPLDRFGTISVIRPA
jgi:hypothetical protein